MTTTPLDPPPRRPRVPVTVTAGRHDRFALTLLALEVLALPVAVLVVPPADRLRAAAVALVAIVLLAAVPVAGLQPTGWVLTWARWLRRRAAVRRPARQATSAPVSSLPVSSVPVSSLPVDSVAVDSVAVVPARPVVLPVPPVVSGALVGPRRSEIGVLWSPGGWTGALYVADDGPDAVARLLALPASGSGAVRLRSVLQQRSPLGSAGTDLLPLSAWLVVQVDPMPVIRAREAVGAVPALLRSEVRGLFDHTRPGAVGLVALDHADLLDALAATAEQPKGRGAPDADERWDSWRAAGRTHRAFAVRGGGAPPTTIVDLLLDGVSLAAGSTVTVAVRHEPGLRWPIVARVSHPDPGTVTDVVRQLRPALAAEGIRTRGLGGRQGTALVDTTLLATTT